MLVEESVRMCEALRKRLCRYRSNAGTFRFKNPGGLARYLIESFSREATVKVYSDQLKARKLINDTVTYSILTFELHKMGIIVAHRYFTQDKQSPIWEMGEQLKGFFDRETIKNLMESLEDETFYEEDSTFLFHIRNSTV